MCALRAPSRERPSSRPRSRGYSGDVTLIPARRGSKDEGRSPSNQSSAGLTRPPIRRNTEGPGAGNPPRNGGSEVLKYHIMGQPGSVHRAAVNGRVRRPKLETDVRRLNDLLAYCRAGNFRETRALVAHYPFLLTFTDQYGMTALHHAEMSGDPRFVSQVLTFYRNPRSFVAKQLQYDTEEEMLADYAGGFSIQREYSETLGNVVVVKFVGEDTLAREAGIMVGDMLETLGGASFLGMRHPPPVGEDILDALRVGSPGSFGFPVTLEFRGSACQEILTRAGWTPAHAAAGFGGSKHQQILEQLLDDHDEGALARDHVGCSPEDWARIYRDTVSKRGRRPLSAGASGRQGGLPSRPGSANRAYSSAAAAPPDAGYAILPGGAQSSALGSRRPSPGLPPATPPQLGPPPGMVPPSAARGDAPPAPLDILCEAARGQSAFCRPLAGGGKQGVTGYCPRPPRMVC